MFHNAQGNYSTGRGRDGLGATGMAVLTASSRHGAGVPSASRPAHLKGAPAGKSPVVVAIRPRALTRLQKIRHRRQFVKWIELWAPGLYKEAKGRADAIERQQGVTLGALSGWIDSFTDSVTELGSKYLTLRTQKDILDVQMERMRQGLPPLQTSEYAPTVAVKVDPGTTAEITGAIGTGLGKMVPWILGGGFVLFLLTRKR